MSSSESTFKKSRKGFRYNRTTYGGRPIKFKINIPDSITDQQERTRFYFRERTKLINSQCKEYTNKRCLEWRKNNRERSRRSRLTWERANREKILKLRKTEKYVRLKRKWNELNKEKLKEDPRSYHRRHPEKANASRCRRIARENECFQDGTADAFYKFVRSSKSISCYYCGKSIPGKAAHIDHVIAVSKKGNHAASNLCASCQDCNLRKHSKLPSQITFLNQPLLDL